MIYLPAAASRTTRRLRRAGQVAAVISGTLVAIILYAELHAAGGHGAGAHTSLYAGAILSAVVAASCLSFAFARALISQSTTAVTAELARVAERLDRQDETLRQLVKELARLRDQHRATDPTIGLDPESIEAARAIAKRLLDHPG